MKGFISQTLNICSRFISQTLNICSRFKRKDRKVGRKEKRRDIYVGDCLLGNIADPYKYLFGPWLLKTLLYFRCLLMSKLIHCVVCLLNCLLLRVPFQLHFHLNLFSLNVLFTFKNITREIEIVDYDK